MAFSSKEIERQAGRLEDQLAKYQTTAWSIQDAIEYIREQVPSEDSDLDGTLVGIFNALGLLNDKLYECFTELSAQMRNYAVQTQGNENKAVTAGKTTSSELNDILSQLGNE